jgi:L-threonylcarbamoyladenylate synthase
VSTTIPDISAAIERLRAGGVVAFPTETVYGLGADALSERAVARVYELKGRPTINPLIVHVSGPEMAARLVEEWTEDAAALARTYWPGPLTMVLPRAVPSGECRVPSAEGGKQMVPDLVTAGGPTIAVRCPDHPVALALLFGLESPLVGPSANVSGGVSPTQAAHVREAFSAEDVMVLEGGACRAGIESTVLDLSSARPRILRPGLIDAGELAAALGRPVEEAGAGAVERPTGAPLASPGMLARHYAPRTHAVMVDERDVDSTLRRFPGGAIVISRGGVSVEAPHFVLEIRGDAQEYAHFLYTALREADARGLAGIVIVRPPEDSPLWLAIHDRLRRATTAE